MQIKRAPNCGNFQFLVIPGWDGGWEFIWKSLFKKENKCKLSKLRTCTVKITQAFTIKHKWGAFTHTMTDTKAKCCL
jgi:hypothetical protein